MLLSIVTPVYNAAGFLRHTYRSLCEQDYTDWEWIVVNDASTDESGEILLSLMSQDKRVHYIELAENSGSAKYPRDCAVYHAKGNWIVFLDADDFFSKEYLSKLVARQKQTNADIVYPVVSIFQDKSYALSDEYFVPKDKIELNLPVQDFNSEIIYTGKELLKFVLPDFQIGCAGGLYNKSVWVNMSYPRNDKPIYVHSDEVDECAYLLAAKTVAFTDAIYYYFKHHDSITEKFSLTQFQQMYTAAEVLQLVKDTFDEHSEEFRRANLKLFYTLRSLLRLYVENYDCLGSESDKLYSELSRHFRMLRRDLLELKIRLKFFNFTSFNLLFLFFCLKYRPKTIQERFFNKKN